MTPGRIADPDTAGPDRFRHPDAGFLLAMVLVIVAAGLGGASRENALRLSVVELCATPPLALAARRIVSRRVGAPATWRTTAPLLLLALMVAVPLLQSLPLPPALWSALPGQAPRREALALAGLTLPWLPASLSPAETARMVPALIPPAAMVLIAVTLAPGQARRLAWLWIALASVGLALGVAQMAEPAGGPAYPYRTTNLGSLVGLFANRNHEAGFLLALLPIAAALATPGRADRGSRPGPAPSWVAGVFIVIALVALGVIHSRAGVILAGPAVLGALAVIGAGAVGRQDRRRALGLAAAAAAGVLAVVVFGLRPILDRFAPPGPDAAEVRLEAWPVVLEAARAFLPLGSGLGSFDRVYQAAEPLTLVVPLYLNHAHNEYLELLLETGVFGAAILALFLLWLAPAAFAAWRGGGALARAASVSIVLLLAQSAVDYPLRTESVAVLFAFCCGLLARPDPGRG